MTGSERETDRVAATSRSVADREAAVLDRARAGDDEAFQLLTAPVLRGLHVHCYRMLGSLHEAEDLVQETLLRAWRGLDRFQGRSSFRSWLYRIATNACLDALEQRRRRLLPNDDVAPDDPTAPPAPPAEAMLWVEPYPDSLLDAAGDSEPSARYEARESIELGFIVAIQYLSPRQRAVLILRDVLGFSARETAAALETSVASVNSALHRARAALTDRLPDDGAQTLTSDDASLLDRYVRAWDEADVQGLVALLRDDAIMTMPPTPSWYAGRDAIGAFFATLFEGEFAGKLRVVPTRANRQPALAVYLRDSSTGVHRPFAIKVLTLRGREIQAITGFADPSLFPLFGLPEVRSF